MFWAASENSIDVYTYSVTGLIRKCVEDVVPTVMIRSYPTQTPCTDGSIRAKLKSENHCIQPWQGDWEYGQIQTL